MKHTPSQTARTIGLALALAVVALSGCALDRLPRIDPSGQNFLIFPGDTVATVPGAAPTVPGAAPGTVLTPNIPGAAATGIAAPAGNLAAPPALPGGQVATSPACPLCPLCPFGACCPLGGPDPIIGPLASQPGPQSPTDQLKLTPARVLAPVGSEVVLRAGVCGADGYFRTNKKIEWMLGREGAGQFVTIGERGEMDMLRWPWSTPRKVDNFYAVGYTAPFYTCLRRGNENPADDLQVQKGEAWVTVSSASEGTSYVTAYAPDVEDWSRRKASTTIYWIDAQWQLPPNAVVAAGQTHRLVTTVTRQSDGAPLAGWIVRYEVAEGSTAQLGYDAGQSTEVTTDGRGQASADVTPTDAQPGTAQIRVVIVRPEQAGVAASPRLDIGSGETVVSWSTDAPGTQPILPPVEPPPALPTTPPPGLPTTPGDPPISVPPTQQGRPELEVRMTRVTPDPIRVDDLVRYRILVRNTGDAAARNILFVDDFDVGLTNEYDRERRQRISNPDMADLGPGESGEVELDFRVTQPGNLCHRVTVTADGADDGFEQDCFDAEAVVPLTPTVTLLVEGGDQQRTAGDQQPITFRAVVRNTDTTAATGLVVSVRYPPQLSATFASEGNLQNNQATPDRLFSWSVPRLEPGQERVFRLVVVSVEPTIVDQPACVLWNVQGEAGINSREEACVEVLPAANPGPGVSPLRVTITENVGPAQVGDRGTLYVTVENTGTAPQQQVQLELNIPAQIKPLPNLAQTQTPPGTQLQLEPPIIRLNPTIAELRFGESARIILPFDPIRQGQAVIGARARSSNATTWVDATREIDINPAG